MNVQGLMSYLLYRNGSFPLDNCEVLTGALLKLINKCYWNTTDSDGCMTSDENELSEACIKTLTVNIDQNIHFQFRPCCIWGNCTKHLEKVL